MLLSQPKKFDSSANDQATELDDSVLYQNLAVKWSVLRRVFGALLAPLCLAVLVVISPETTRLFLKELVLSLFIIMALVFMNRGTATNRKN